jgi:hypothetical protein
MWIWTTLLSFRRYILPPSSRSKCVNCVSVYEKGPVLKNGEGEENGNRFLISPTALF